MQTLLDPFEVKPRPVASPRARQLTIVDLSVEWIDHDASEVPTVSHAGRREWTEE